MKKLDFKTIVIVILGACLIISFLFKQKSNINIHEDELKKLHVENSSLVKKNDSLLMINKELDKKILSIDKELQANQVKLDETTNQLERLTNRKNEIPTYINNLSANGVSNEFSKYLENTKGSNTR